MGSLVLEVHVGNFGIVFVVQLSFCMMAHDVDRYDRYGIVMP